MRRGGFARVRQLAKEQKERLGDGEFARKLILKDGETAVVWFTGTADEPHIFRRHYHPTFGYFYCAEKKCVACNEAAKGSKAFKKGTSMAAFNIVDTRWFHKIPRKNEDDRYDYVLCDEDASCKYCRKKVERIRAGKRLAEFALTWGDALGAQEEKINKKCASCHTGKIRVVEYNCPECGELLDWAPDPDMEESEQIIKCGECKKRVRPMEVIECTKCDDPVRGSIFEYGCPVEITRSGERKNTSYNFNPVWPPEEPEDWVMADDMKPFDLEKKYKQMVMSPSAMAEKIGVVNPFDEDEKAKVEEYEQANPFDDDDDDDDEVF